MPSANSAHAFTNPRERIPEITATGANVPTETLRASTAAEIPFTISNSTLSKSRLSDNLSPLVFGTATFNYQFNPDPYALSPTEIVCAALEKGIRAFDTSPYYGPAEEILGTALHSDLVKESSALHGLRREDYFILTKCGRIEGKGDEFDYSPEWIRHSVKRSLRRLGTKYLDVVYLHDVEFVSSEEVLTGVKELRRIRDELGWVKYIGICGYPVDTLCELAEMIVKETGKPLDIVQSYANFTIQNQRLLSGGLERLINAGVDVVTNASPLGMGLCRSQGVPVGAMGNWHPAPDGLREVCLKAAKYVENEHGEKLEIVAVRFAMEAWLAAGAEVGARGVIPEAAIARLNSRSTAQRDAATPRLGVNVMGVSKLSELEDTMSVYDALLADHGSSPPSERAQQVIDMTTHIREKVLGNEWTDFAWSSPDPGFVNRRKHFGVSEAEKKELDSRYGANGGVKKHDEGYLVRGVVNGADLKNASQLEIKELLDAVDHS